MEAVTFRMSARAMQLMGWVDRKPRHEDPAINEIIEAAKCTFKKTGRGGYYVFRCDERQAKTFEELVFQSAHALRMSTNKEDRQEGRVLLAAAEKIDQAIKATKE